MERDNAAKRLAKEYGVSERTIRRDGKFIEALNSLKPYVPDIEQRAMSGDLPAWQRVIDAATIAKTDIEQAKEILREPRYNRQKKAAGGNGAERTKCPFCGRYL